MQPCISGVSSLHPITKGLRVGLSSAKQMPNHVQRGVGKGRRPAFLFQPRLDLLAGTGDRKLVVQMSTSTCMSLEAFMADFSLGCGCTGADTETNL